MAGTMKTVYLDQAAITALETLNIKNLSAYLKEKLVSDAGLVHNKLLADLKALEIAEQDMAEIAINLRPDLQAEIEAARRKKEEPIPCPKCGALHGPVYWSRFPCKCGQVVECMP